MTLDEINRRSPAAPQRSPAAEAAHKLHGRCRFPVTTHFTWETIGWSRLFKKVE
jgi:hypothetical protein